MTGERCYCGDTECPSCGTAQGTRGMARDEAYAAAMERVDSDAAKRHRHRAQNTIRTVIDADTAQRHALTAELAVCGCGATRRTEIDRGPWVQS